MEEAQVSLNSEQETLGDATKLQALPGEQLHPTKSPDDGAVQGTARSKWTHVKVAGCSCTPKEIAKKAVLGAVLVVVWMALSVPAVMFYLPQDDSAAVTPISTTADSNTCLETEIYHGGVCREALQAVQPCISSDQSVDGPIFIPASGRQQEIETQAQTLISALPLLQPSQACEDAVVPLLCLYLFGVCSNDENGTLHQPSSQQCSVIKSDTCASEWRMAESFLGRESLPDCTLLPDKDNHLDCQDTVGTESNTSTVTDSNTTTTNNITCSDDFYFNGERCQPECGEWEEWSSTAADVIDGFVILAMTICVIGSTVTTVISCIQYKRMLKFPPSLIVYQSVGLFVLGVVILVGYMDRKTLFCSSRDLLKTIYNPTAFCTITGVVFSYVLLQLVFWWLCYCVMVFWSIKFPFHYRSYRNSQKMKYIHIAVLVLGLVLSGLPVAVTFGTGEYVLNQFPASLCLVDNKDAIFYSLILPISIHVAAGMSLLIIVFFEMFKVIKSGDKIRNAQAKIMIVLLYYIAVGVSGLTAFAITQRNFSAFVDELSAYFICEGAGTGEPCDRSGFMKYNNAVATTVSVVIVGLLPAVNLAYVAKFRSIYATCRGWCGHKDKDTS